MTHRWIVTALGKDRPGIVAGVTKVLYQLGCNLEDSAMTRLEGEFAIMLIFSAPVRVSAERLQKAFASIERQLKLVIHLKALSAQETRTTVQRAQSYLLSVYGADRPGIVYRVSEALAKAEINITNVETHRSRGSASRRSPSLYLMMIEVEVPRRIPAAWLEQQLRKLKRTLGVEISFSSTETDVL